jgi:transposase
MFELLATLELCKIGMEACSGALDTALRLRVMGHDARFVPIKSGEQQAVLCLHRIRAAQIHARSSLINDMRGMLTEFGVVMPKGWYNFQDGVAFAIDQPEVPELARQLIADLHCCEA